MFSATWVLIVTRGSRDGGRNGVPDVQRGPDGGGQGGPYATYGVMNPEWLAQRAEASICRTAGGSHRAVSSWIASFRRWFA